jgi:amino acid permease
MFTLWSHFLAYLNFIFFSGRTVENWSSFHEEIKKKIKFGKSLQISSSYLPSFNQLPKNVHIAIGLYNITYLYVLLCTVSHIKEQTNWEICKQGAEENIWT